jgi:hypothetical protein
MSLRNSSLVALALPLLMAPPVVAQLTCTITQITDSTGGSSLDPSLDGGAIAFHSSANLTGGNPDGTFEIFFFDGVTITQVADSATGGSNNPSLDGGAIAFHATDDPTGEGPTEIFLASCTATPPSSVLEIPTLGQWGLGTLAFLLAGAGLALRGRWS